MRTSVVLSRLACSECGCGYRVFRESCTGASDVWLERHVLEILPRIHFVRSVPLRSASWPGVTKLRRHGLFVTKVICGAEPKDLTVMVTANDLGKVLPDLCLRSRVSLWKIRLCTVLYCRGWQTRSRHSCCLAWTPQVVARSTRPLVAAAEMQSLKEPRKQGLRFVEAAQRFP